MNIPLATVLIANHNYSNYIDAAITSAFNQTYQKLGICIIDDGSTDDSWDKINKLFSGEHNTKHTPDGIIVKEAKVNNRLVLGVKLPKATGPSNARNIGIELTSPVTDFYMVLDADDMMLPTKTERFVDKFLEHPDIAVVYADYNIWNIPTDNLITEHKHPYSYRHLLRECIVHSNAGIRKTHLMSVKDQFGYYDVNMRTCEDYDLWIRLAEKYTIAHIPEVLSIVRNHNNNSTLSVNNEVWQQNWNRIQQKTQLRNQ